MSFLLEPFEPAFMQRALLAVCLASLNCGAVGVFIVLRRMAFIGDALAHTILPGVVFAYLRGLQIFWGALGASILTALGISLLASRRDVREDSAIGVIFSAMFALGLLMMSASRSFVDFHSLIFGNPLGIIAADLWLIGGVTLIVLGAVAVLLKPLELSSYDPEHARLQGLSTQLLRTSLLILTALAVVTAVKIVGALLTTALLITPAATALLLCRHLLAAIATAMLIGMLSGFCGLVISYHFGVSSGASIVLTATGIFLMAWALRQLQSMLGKNRQRGSTTDAPPAS